MRRLPQEKGEKTVKRSLSRRPTAAVLLLGLLCLLLLPPVLSSCESGGEDGTRVKVVCTLFPQYDFARQIAGESAEVVLLRKNGDAHGGEVTSQDVRTILSASLFLCEGGVEDLQYEKIISENAPSLPVWRMLDVCDPVYSGDEIDEHVWTSPKKAIELVGSIRDELIAVDPDSADVYKENAEKYLEKLRGLEERYSAYFAAERVLVFGDRFPFAHLAADYGVVCRSAFPGCSEESEPSAKAVSDLIDFVRDNGIGRVFKLENSDGKIASSIAAATGAKVYTLHSCHAVTPEEEAAGLGYYELMEKNLETLASS